MRVIRYETPVEEVQNLEGKIVFLAGPTVRGNQQHLTSWRFEAIEIFEKLGFDGTLIVPEFTSKSESDQHKDWIPLWEYEGLKVSTTIMFWIPRTKELIGLTTNHEHGYWMGREIEKVVYGRPDDAYRMSYLDIMWRKVHEEQWLPCKIYTTLEETIKASCDFSPLLD